MSSSKEYHTREALLEIIRESKKELKQAREIMLKNESLKRLNKELVLETKRLNHAKIYLERELKNIPSRIIADNESQGKIIKIRKQLEDSENEKKVLQKQLLEQKLFVSDNMTYGAARTQLIKVSDIFYNQSHKFMNDIYYSYSVMMTEIQDHLKTCMEIMYYNNEMVSARSIALLEKTIKSTKRTSKTEKELMKEHRQKFKDINKETKPLIKEVADRCKKTLTENDSIVVKGCNFFSFNELKGLSLNKAYMYSVLDNNTPEIEIPAKYNLLKEALETKEYYLDMKNKKIEIGVLGSDPNKKGHLFKLWTHPSELTVAKWTKKKTLGEFKGCGTLVFESELEAQLFYNKISNFSKILLE